jgi:hypothetical protein
MMKIIFAAAASPLPTQTITKDATTIVMTAESKEVLELSDENHLCSGLRIQLFCGSDQEKCSRLGEWDEHCISYNGK